MNAASLLSDLQAQGVHLELEAGALRYRAPKGTITPGLLATLKTHKADLIAVLSARQRETGSIDWNNHPDTPPTDPFTRGAIQDIKAGKAVPVWSAVLGEWLWFVKDSDAQLKLIAQGCQSPIYTLGELAIVADMRLNSSFGPEDLKRGHAIKKKFGAAIDWPPKEAG
jgi:hypothetical protein